MATLTEDYVSFETALLLKKKGFEQVGCQKQYNTQGDLCVGYCYGPVAPTLQMAMKWLREVHNIMVSPYALSLGYYFEIFDLTDRDITGCKALYKVGIPFKEDILNTYEEACEAALKYCLENLI